MKECILINQNSPDTIGISVCRIKKFLKKELRAAGRIMDSPRTPFPILKNKEIPKKGIERKEGDNDLTMCFGIGYYRKIF